jgi:hypothetical protein
VTNVAIELLFWFGVVKFATNVSPPPLVPPVVVKVWPSSVHDGLVGQGVAAACWVLARPPIAAMIRATMCFFISNILCNWAAAIFANLSDKIQEFPKLKTF